MHKKRPVDLWERTKFEALFPFPLVFSRPAMYNHSESTRQSDSGPVRGFLEETFMKKLAAFLAALTGLTAALAIGVHAAEPVDVVNIPEKAVTVDGVIADGEWDGATRMVLNISDTSTWSEFGAGIVGTDGWSQLGHTDDDFTTELAFTVDGEDLYILLTRKDSTLNFASDNYHRPYSSDCALMWFYDTAEYDLDECILVIRPENIKYQK